LKRAGVRLNTDNPATRHAVQLLARPGLETTAPER